MTNRTSALVLEYMINDIMITIHLYKVQLQHIENSLDSLKKRKHTLISLLEKVEGVNEGK